MLRELHEVLVEMQDSVAPHAQAARANVASPLGSTPAGGGAGEVRPRGRRVAGVRLQSLRLVLPLDMVAVFRGGSCALLADVPRNHADAHWRGGGTRLGLSMVAEPSDE